MAKRKKEMSQEEVEISRIVLPKGNQVFGVVLQLLGSGRMMVRCSDGKDRICRIPGKIRRRLWIKPGDVILVQPWQVQGDKKGDIVVRYTPTQINWLKRRGILEKDFDII
ncbi:MAG: translation initiation factor eIF-1A [Candidatus Aenigmarchaeota archaeon]|nr:translation initiation factor eIF-1A [Candidatus Aenigmarchaeota archaeon]